mmetsp:Transcript_3150/g.3995  ORF Transcript_3150/g.3995 Transcript_3150/m.3995 type:complete len:92 (+) Transcript_3150:151-426(+)
MITSPHLRPYSNQTLPHSLPLFGSRHIYGSSDLEVVTVAPVRQNMRGVADAKSNNVAEYILHNEVKRVYHEVVSRVAVYRRDLPDWSVTRT